jgi:putative membrane protein
VHPALSYASYVLAGLALLAVFFVIYTRFTPYSELEMIRNGNRAVAYFLSGALLGFSATIATSILTHSSFVGFLAWSVGALVVQILVYTIMNRLFPDLNKYLRENNTAVGMMSGVAAICAGLINAACLYS